MSKESNSTQVAARQVATQAASGTSVTTSDAFKSALKQMGSHFSQALAPYSDMTAERFIQAAQTAINIRPELLKCDRNSLFTSLMQAAQDGLYPDGREGAITEYGGKAKWMPMLQGVVKKILSSGQVSKVDARVVYDADEFEYFLGDNERIEHKPCVDGDPGEVRCSYAIVHFKDGTIKREVMGKRDLLQAKDASKSKDSASSPWNKWEGEMCRKSVVHRISKYLPLTPEIADVIRRSVVDEPADVTPVSRQPVALESLAKPVAKLDKFEQQSKPDAEELEVV